MSVVRLVEIIEHYPKREEYFTDGEFAMACERFFKYKLKPKFEAFKMGNVCIPRNKFEPFYDNLKKHTELDVQSGYYVSKERKEVLKILEWLLEESK